MGHDGQLFSIRAMGDLGNRIFYAGVPLQGHPVLNEARIVAAGHVVPSHDSHTLYRSLIFCIASQALNFERPVQLTRQLRTVPLEQVSDGTYVYQQVERYMRFKGDRFSPMLSYAREYAGGIEALADDLLNHPHFTRLQIARQVHNMGCKTASFWYLCLGGKDLMTLDVHNFRQLAGLGLLFRQSFYDPPERKSGVTEGKKILGTPTLQQYLTLERIALDFLGQFPEFVGQDGKVDGAFATNLFWWAGARAARNKQPGQPLLFGPEFTSPWIDDKS